MICAIVFWELLECTCDGLDGGVDEVVGWKGGITVLLAVELV